MSIAGRLATTDRHRRRNQRELRFVRSLYTESFAPPILIQMKRQTDERSNCLVFISKNSGNSQRNADDIGLRGPAIRKPIVAKMLLIVLVLLCMGGYVLSQVSKPAYASLLKCVRTTDINDCDDVPSGGPWGVGAKLTNPLGGVAHQVDGADRYRN